MPCSLLRRVKGKKSVDKTLNGVFGGEGESPLEEDLAFQQQETG